MSNEAHAEQHESHHQRIESIDKKIESESSPEEIGEHALHILTQKEADFHSVSTASMTHIIETSGLQPDEVGAINSELGTSARLQEIDKTAEGLVADAKKSIADSVERMYAKFRNQLSSKLSSAKNFQDLYRELDEVGGIQGSQKSYSSEELRGIITMVREDPTKIDYVTSAGGLRGVVENLIKQETSSGPLEGNSSSIKVIRTNGDIESDWSIKENAPEGYVVVTKVDPITGETLLKDIPSEEFYSSNPDLRTSVESSFVAPIDEMERTVVHIPQVESVQENEGSKSDGATPKDGGDRVRESAEGVDTASGQHSESNHLKNSEERNVPDASVTQEKQKSVEWPEISKFLKSNEFTSSLSEFGPTVRGRVVGYTLEYMTLFKDPAGAQGFIEDVKSLGLKGEGLSSAMEDARVNEILIKKIAEKLNINDVGSLEGKSKVFNFFRDHYVNEGYYFHAFNGAFKESIAEDGIAINKRAWDWEDLNKIATIGRKAGHNMLLGWAGINSESKTSVASTPRDVLQYAAGSPEWFSQFVSGGFHVPNEGNRKKAYYLRDYAVARENVENLCNDMMSASDADIKEGRRHPNISEGEKMQILNFFEKYWEKFAGNNSTLNVAVIERSFIEQYKETGTFEDYAKMLGEAPEAFNLSSAISMLKGSGGGVDVQVGKNIPSSAIKILDLPNYAEVYPEYV
ncbi:MAG TPA: hypothetical protein VJ579_01530 [Candidatus Paceibacterota bacterium]|nr:hypothetical protein [Candidatus Paceibacterota bacterium]